MAPSQPGRGIEEDGSEVRKNEKEVRESVIHGKYARVCVRVLQHEKCVLRETKEEERQSHLHDVSDDTIVVEISAAAFGSEIFRKNQLHVLDVFSIPKRLEYQV